MYGSEDESEEDGGVYEGEDAYFHNTGVTLDTPVGEGELDLPVHDAVDHLHRAIHEEFSFCKEPTLDERGPNHHRVMQSSKSGG